MSNCRLRRHVLWRMTGTHLNPDRSGFVVHKNTQPSMRTELKYWNSLRHTLRDFSYWDTIFYLFYHFSLHSRPRNGLRSTLALGDMHKGSRADIFSTLQVKLTESVIVSVEH